MLIEEYVWPSGKREVFFASNHAYDQAFAITIEDWEQLIGAIKAGAFDTLPKVEVKYPKIHQEREPRNG